MARASTSWKPGQCGGGKGNPAWVKGGKSPNPGGKPKMAEVRWLARDHTVPAIMALVKNLKDRNGSVRNIAAIALLDRGYGKPQQESTVTIVKAVREMTDAELDTILARYSEGEEAEEADPQQFN